MIKRLDFGKKDARFYDLFRPEKHATEELAQERLSICEGCPELIKATKTCKECGCFMVAKTKLQAAECPLGKW